MTKLEFQQVIRRKFKIKRFQIITILGIKSKI